MSKVTQKVHTEVGLELTARDSKTSSLSSPYTLVWIFASEMEIPCHQPSSTTSHLQGSVHFKSQVERKELREDQLFIGESVSPLSPLTLGQGPGS